MKTSGFIVVVPAFNEARTVRDLARRALQYADHVVVVDDGSTDGTAGRLAGLRVPVIRHPRNLGKAAALRAGIRWGLCRGSAIITMDADGQHRPEDIPALREAFDREPGAIVIGARVRNASAIPLSRKVAHATARFWISLAARVAIGDSQSGFRLYPGSVLEALEGRCNWTNGFALESELLIEAGRLGIPIREVPIEALYHRRFRRSHYRQFRDTWTITRMVTRKILRPRSPHSAVDFVADGLFEDDSASRIEPRSYV
ncbi:glycosyl transferase [Nitrospira sp.]|nr:glycosyl transferase [Nitrospira sp.]